jgi:predicted phosphoribosyltransferase
MTLQFRDRVEAGRLLEEKLKRFRGREDAVVLALPRGGGPVGFEVAMVLHLPLEVFVVRKLGLPGHEELAIGAIASGNTSYINEDIVKTLRVSSGMLESVIQRERQELTRRESRFRDPHQPLNLTNKTVILVDDGLATGATMHAAVNGVKIHEPAAVIVAVPVSARDTYNKFKHEVDDIIAVALPEDFASVGQWYRNFNQTTDEEVAELLERARSAQEGFRIASSSH